jgi:hypothetical protein
VSTHAGTVEQHRTRTTVLIGLVSTTVLLLRMFVPGPVGLSDQGDGHRLLCQLGLANDVAWNVSQSSFVRFTWVSHVYFGETCGANGTGQPVYSSQLLLDRIATWLTPVLGLPGSLDLRALAVLCCVVAGAAVGWLVHEMRGARFARVIVGAVVTLILADSGIAVYFASPYSEGGAFLGLLLLLPASLRLLRSRRTSLATIVTVLAIGTFVLASKTQMVTFLPLLLVVLLVRPGQRGTGGQVTGQARWRSARVRRRAAGSLACLGLVGVAVATLSAEPPRFQELHVYKQVFLTILPGSPDPTGDLQFFGLDPSLARGSGIDINGPGSVVTDPAYVGFTDKVTSAKVVEFYLTHPARTVGLVHQGLDYAATFRLSSYLANYPEASGNPAGTADHRVEVLTEVFTVFKALPLLLLIVWIVGLVRFSVAARRGSCAGLLGLGLTLSIVTQFGAVLLSEGYAEAIKHMIVVDYATALMFPVAIMVWTERRARRTVDRPGTSTTVSTPSVHTELSDTSVGDRVLPDAP